MGLVFAARGLMLSPGVGNGPTEQEAAACFIHLQKIEGTDVALS